jgi:hypothetical protein
VSLNVGEALLRDAKQGRFLIRRQTAEIVGQIEIYMDAGAPDKTVRVPLQSRGEAIVVQRGWVQEVGKISDFLHTAIGELDALGNNDATFWVKRADLQVHSRQVHGQSGQVLRRTVMEF